MSTISNLFIDAGSDYTNIITVKASNGLPLNLTGCTVRSQMRKSYNSSSAHAFTAEVHNPLAGQVILRLSAAESELIKPGRWLYDIEITNPSGGRKRVTEGVATVTPQITQI